MVNETVRKEHVFVIQQDYYYRMVNDHKQIRKVKHRATKILIKIIHINMIFEFILLPKHQLFQENMEDIERVQELHN
jgi:hypothetical protein